MNHESALKVQAWLDGELAAGPAAEVAAWVAQDPAARELAAELRTTRNALRDGEVSPAVPESREFYWSKIEQAIRRAEAAAEPASSEPRFAWVFRFLVPAGIVAVLTLLLATPLLRDHNSSGNVVRSEIESPLDDLSSFTFRSESEGMTVVWINTR